MQKIQRSTLAALLLVALLFSSVVPAYAQDVAPDTPDETNQLYLPAILRSSVQGDVQGDVEAAGKASGQAVPFRGDRIAAVMTRNLYLGADLAPLLPDPSEPPKTLEQFIAAVTQVYLEAMLSDIPGRMDAVATEIAATQPALIGLQEVTTFSIGASPYPAPADVVQYDYLTLLLSDLSAKGLAYEPVVIVPGFDAQAPALLVSDPPTLFNVRLSVSDVLLARSDLKTADLKLSNPLSGTYSISLTLPTPIGEIPFPRQWASVDAKLRGKSFRFITTHLEAFSPQARFLQAQELLAGPAATSLPTVVVGDFNSEPGISEPGVPFNAAEVMIAAGFVDVWPTANYPAPGYTCCQDPLLRNTSSFANQRIDLILARGGFGVNRGAAQLTGTTPLNLPPIPPLPLGVQWASDHFGVAANVQVPK